MAVCNRIDVFESTYTVVEDLFSLDLRYPPSDATSLLPRDWISEVPLPRLAFSQIDIWCFPKQIRHTLFGEHFFAKWLRRRQTKQRPCCFNRFLLVLISVTVPQLALGWLCLQNVQLTGCSDWLVNVPPVGTSLSLFVWLESGLLGVKESNGSVPVGSQRSLASISESTAFNRTSKSHLGWPIALEIIRCMLGGRFSIRRGTKSFPIRLTLFPQGLEGSNVGLDSIIKEAQAFQVIVNCYWCYLH